MQKCTGGLIVGLLILFNNTVLSQRLPIDTIYNQPFDWLAGQRERLPEWIFTSSQHGCVIGVSDPCMNQEAARMQALQRAAYLYSLRQGVQLKLLSDLFSCVETATNTSDCESNKMLMLGIIEQPLKQGTYQIKKEYTSLFGEKFLQVDFMQTDTCNLEYHSVCELMLVFTQESREEKEFKFSLLLEASCNRLGPIFQSEFEMKGSPENPRIFSFVNGIPIYSLQRDCWYQDYACGGESGDMTNMKNAFWSAYMASFAKALLMYPFGITNIRKVDDRFNGYDGSNRELLREKIVTTLSITPFVKEIKQNHLYVDWQIAEY